MIAWKRGKAQGTGKGEPNVVLPWTTEPRKAEVSQPGSDA